MRTDERAGVQTKIEAGVKTIGLKGYFWMDRGMKRWTLVIAAIVVCGSSVPATAGRPDPKAGGKIAKMICAACHGLDGISLVATYPNLRGQKVKYLIKQLEDFRSGERKSPLLMFPVASKLSDQEIRNLAAFFSSLE